MADRITFADLVTKVQRRTLAPDEAGRYFVLDAARTTGLHPRFRIDPSAVDLAGLEGTATDAGHALAVEAGFGMLGAAPAAGPAPDGSIVAEGDSWFRLPPILYPPTLADVLAQSRPVNNLAHWGDELATMYNDGKGQYVPYLKAGTVRFLLFSGGGNDILGDTFEQCLELFDVGHTDPSEAAYYLTPFFYAKLAEVQRLYEAILTQIARFSPSTVLVVHGYDYAIPRGNGPFLGIHMQNRGLYPAYHEALCRAIVRRMIDLFNERLAYLAQHYPNVRHVDLRGTVGEDDWFDGEIHPNREAAIRLAQRVETVLPSIARRTAGRAARSSGGGRTRRRAPA